jgi:hypothetical protein
MGIFPCPHIFSAETSFEKLEPFRKVLHTQGDVVAGMGNGQPFCFPFIPPE